MMKKSTLFELAMASVINDKEIATMNKVEILAVLFDCRELELFREKEAEKKNA